MPIVARSLGLGLALALAIACDRGAEPPAEPSVEAAPAPAEPSVEATPAEAIPEAATAGPPAMPEAAPPTVVKTSRVKAAKLRRRLAHATWIGALAWSADGARLATGDDDGAVQLWDAASGAATVTVAKLPRRVTALAWDADGARVAIAASTDLVVVDAATGAALARLAGHEDLILDLAFVGGDLLAVDVRNQLRRWSVAPAGLVWALEVPTIHKLSALLGPGARTLALGGYGDLGLLAIPTVTPLHAWSMPRCREAPKDPLCAGWKTRQMEEFGHDGGPPSTYTEDAPNWYVQSLAFSADGSRLAAGRADGVAIVVDTVSGAAIGRFVISDDHRASLALSGDGEALAVADSEGKIALFEVASAKKLELRGAGEGSVGPLAFSADASALAVGGPGQAVTIWDLQR